MGLRFRVDSTPETLQDMSLAAEERFAEGLDLVTLDRHWSGVYLLGYSAEMNLKASFFRLGGERPSQQVKGLLAPARKMGERFFPGVPCELYHSLWFWCLMLRRRRRLLSRAPDAHFRDSELLRQTRRLHQTWWVEMRYRPAQIQPSEAIVAVEAASWIRHHAVDFWR